MVTFDVLNQPFIFVTNPKSGVSTTAQLLGGHLHEHFQRHDRLDATRIHPHKWAAYVFRNPYERVVSAFFRFNRVLWTDRTERRADYTRRILERYRKPAGFTFEDFLRFLEETPNNERDVHYRAQDVPIRYEFLVQTDRFLADVLYFFEDIGYLKGKESLARKSRTDVMANVIKKGARKDWGDVLSLRTPEFERFEQDGYPPYAPFLTSTTRRSIERIFGYEVALHHALAEVPEG